MHILRGVGSGLAFALLALPQASHGVAWNDGAPTYEYQLVEAVHISWPDSTDWIVANLGDDWYLATITSAAEQAFVTQNVFAGRVGEYWIGGYQDPTK